jgi:hypothetical protein
MVLRYYTFIWQFFAGSCEHRCETYNFVVVALRNRCGDEVEDISIYEPRSDISASEAEITDSDLDSSVDIKSLQWVNMKI